MARISGCRGIKEGGITEEHKGTLGVKCSVTLDYASGFTDIYTCQNILDYILQIHTDYILWTHIVYCMSFYFNKTVLKICMTLDMLLKLEFTHP